jgi:predicted ArsR family transcriptional regulator
MDGDDDATGDREHAGNLFATTAGRTLVLLCRGRRTVAELAADLGVTANAVRAQLQRLQRGGLVRRAGLRPGVRRPHGDYELTARARRLFPRAYEPVLVSLVGVLVGRLPPETVRTVLREAGGRLLRDLVGGFRARDPLQRAAEFAGRLGEVMAGIELEETANRTVIRSCSCPIASVTASHPELCGLVAGLLSDAIGATVRERCEKGEAPQCRFEVAPDRHRGGRQAGTATGRRATG